MNKKVIMYILALLCLIMPIISVEGIVPWIVSLTFIHFSFKAFNKTNNIKRAVYNTIYCGAIIFIYNVLGRYIEKILVDMWM